MLASLSGCRDPWACPEGYTNANDVCTADRDAGALADAAMGKPDAGQHVDPAPTDGEQDDVDGAEGVDDADGDPDAGQGEIAVDAGSDAAIDAGPEGPACSTEVCDGDDNDCDGRTDEGVTVTAYVDADRDGHGDKNAQPEAVCANDMAGKSFTKDDCADGDAKAFPGSSHRSADKVMGKNDWDYNCDGRSQLDSYPLCSDATCSEATWGRSCRTLLLPPECGVSFEGKFCFRATLMGNPVYSWIEQNSRFVCR